MYCRGTLEDQYVMTGETAADSGGHSADTSTIETPISNADEKRGEGRYICTPTIMTFSRRPLLLVLKIAIL